LEYCALWCTSRPCCLPRLPPCPPGKSPGPEAAHHQGRLWRVRRPLACHFRRYAADTSQCAILNMSVTFHSNAVQEGKKQKGNCFPTAAPVKSQPLQNGSTPFWLASIPVYKSSSTSSLPTLNSPWGSFPWNFKSRLMQLPCIDKTCHTICWGFGREADVLLFAVQLTLIDR